MCLNSLLGRTVNSGDSVNLDLSLGVNIKVFRLHGLDLEEVFVLLLVQLAKGLADMGVLHVSKLGITHILNHDLVMLFIFLQLLDFLVRHEVLLKLDS